ncbi:AAA family ATPase [Nocardia sp. CDC160]|uniref:AAA family ATPase n=1 Tax=Nocardia sp. CDC160 TaxID=3112166 RepID=UPI002DBE766B|nr:AAA family ATPase [Nocardia sp. CDC160]MEC3919303.1 AAA family ATPase [Nocardia sp. CDC160]
MSAPNEVDRPITVAVMGTHSTGKTTFLERLEEELRRNRIEVATVADLGYHALKAGLPILDQHTWASTLWIMTRGISNELEAWLHADVVLIDRGVPDALGYYEAALEYSGRQPDPQRIKHLEELVVSHSQNYDLVLRTVLDPDKPLGDNKPRDTDLKFRALAGQRIEAVMTRLGIGHDVLTSAGHDRALVDAKAYIGLRLSEPELKISWDDDPPPAAAVPAS